MGNMCPESKVLRTGKNAYCFKNGEVLPAGSFSGGRGKLNFALYPDGENPKCAEILTVGKMLLKMEGFQLRVQLGERSFLHPAVLNDSMFNALEIAADGRLIRISVNIDRVMVISGAEMLDGEAVFSGSEKRYFFRGMVTDISCGDFSGEIVPPEKTAGEVPEIAVPDDFPDRISLEGEWEFFCTPRDFDAASPLPDKKLYTAKMVIPGYWDDHTDLIMRTRSFDRSAKTNPRFRPLSLPMGEITPDASMPFLVGTGYYRKCFRFAPGTLPAAVILELGPAVWGSAVYCNGKLLSVNTGYSTGSRVDLSETLDFDGGINTIVIAVSNYKHVFDGNTQENSQHIGLAVRGYQGMRCGIDGYCRLKFVAAGSITDAWADFRNGKLNLYCEISGVEADVRWTLKDACGKTVKTASGKNPVIDGDGLSRWSDTAPVLYEISAESLVNGKCSDRVQFSYGLREMRCEGPRMFLNGEPVYLRGATEHYYFPETANAPYDFDKYLRDIRTWQELGFNFLRFHTWCPPEPYLAAADVCGMICQVEVPPHVEEAEWIRILKYLRRHVSVAVICGGNEEDFTEFRIGEVRRLAELTRELMPGTLFNPQEGLAKVEYRLAPDEPGVATEPFIHDPEKFRQLAEFSDVYGSYSWGYFSYIHTMFPGAEEVDKRYTVHKKPILSHEIGIMGGWLDFRNEARYHNTVVPGDVYKESRKHLEKYNLFHRADEFFRLNSAFVNRLRKAMFENLRSCISLNGYDCLGVCDAHWHRCGYPCGILDEFNQCKPGVIPAEIRQYNGASILLCDLDNYRNFRAGELFKRTISVSHFGKGIWRDAVLQWHIDIDGQEYSGVCQVPEIAPGTLTAAGSLEITLPEIITPAAGVLKCKLIAGETVLENHWDFWVFPEVSGFASSDRFKVVRKLDDEVIDFIAEGGKVLLTANFPAGRMLEKFQVVTTGRSAGHLGTVIAEHPLMAQIPHQGFADWQFFDMLQFAASMDFTDSQLPFNPLIEYIPSFKNVFRKTPLCELRIGEGTLMMCGLRLDNPDPGTLYFKSRLFAYLTQDGTSSVPAVDSGLLKSLIRQEFPDSGVAKTDEAWDPNVSAGKKQDPAAGR